MNFLERSLRKLERKAQPPDPLQVNIVVFSDRPLPSPYTNNGVTVSFVRLNQEHTE